jgi:hypothetical protein
MACKSDADIIKAKSKIRIKFIDFVSYSSFTRLVTTSSSLLICAGILAGCSGSSNNG